MTEDQKERTRKNSPAPPTAPGVESDALMFAQNADDDLIPVDHDDLSVLPRVYVQRVLQQPVSERELLKWAGLIADSGWEPQWIQTAIEKLIAKPSPEPLPWPEFLTRGVAEVLLTPEQQAIWRARRVSQSPQQLDLVESCK